MTVPVYTYVTRIRSFSSYLITAYTQRGVCCYGARGLDGMPPRAGTKGERRGAKNTPAALAATAAAAKTNLCSQLSNVENDPSTFLARPTSPPL